MEKNNTHLPVLRKTAIFFIIAGLVYSVNPGSLNGFEKKHAQNTVKEKNNTVDIDPKFYLWMK